jgi:hypothetical protein
MYARIAKIALWVIIVLLLLPGTETEKREMRGTAQKTVDEFGTFCARNSTFCDNFRTAYDGLCDKVRYGAELIEDLLRDHVVAEDGVNGRPTPPPEPRRGAMLHNRGYGFSHTSSLENSDNTLRQDDLAPVWRGPQRL